MPHVDLHQCGSSLAVISRCLKVSDSSFQTWIQKYKKHKTIQRWEHIEATSEDLSQEVEAWVKTGFPSRQLPQDDLKISYKVTLGQQSPGVGLAVTKPWSLSHRKLMSSSLKAKCEQKDLQTWASSTSSVKRSGPRLQETVVESFWKETWNFWPREAISGQTKYEGSLCVLLTLMKEIKIKYWNFFSLYSGISQIKSIFIFIDLKQKQKIPWQ